MKFDFYLGGYGRDHSYRILLKNNNLFISGYIGIPIPEHDKSVSIDKNEDWDRLVEFLPCCEWKRRYDSEILDGTQWELKIKGEGINIKSYGSNAYPEDFDQFMILLNKIIDPTGIVIKI